MNYKHTLRYHYLIVIALILISLGTPSVATTGNHYSNLSLKSELPSVGGYEIISEKTIFSRWRSIISRVVKMPNGNIVDYDVSNDSLTHYKENYIKFKGYIANRFCVF